MKLNALIILFAFLVLGGNVFTTLAGENITLSKSDSSLDAVRLDAHVVVFGASYAKGWNPEKIADQKVVKKGVAGNETHQMLSRYHNDVIKMKPKAVVIWGFINDIFRAESGKLDEKFVKTKENIKEMVSIAKKNGITPIIATEVTITSPDNWKESIMHFIGNLRGKKSYDDFVNNYVIQTNSWLRDLAVKESLILLDFEKVLSDEDNRRKREYALEDGSHLTAEAYKAISSYVEKENLNI